MFEVREGRKERKKDGERECWDRERGKRKRIKRAGVSVGGES